MKNLAAISLATVSLDRDWLGIFGGVLGQAVLIAAVVSLVSGSARSAVDGFDNLAASFGSFIDDKFALCFVCAGAGVALLLYYLFVGQASLTGTLAAVAPASLALSALGRKEGALYTVARSVTARNIYGTLMPDDMRLNGLLSGLVLGSGLAILFSATMERSDAIFITGVALIAIGGMLWLIFGAAAQSGAPR